MRVSNLRKISMQQQHSFEAFEISFSSEDSSLWLPIQWLLLLLSM
jgi:hypothetical protein